MTIHIREQVTADRPWHVRMAQARRWHAHQMRAHLRRPPNYAALMAVAADVIAKRLNGWTLAKEKTPADIRSDYIRVIRRNLGKGRLP